MYHYGNRVTKRHVEGHLYAGKIGRQVYEPVFACMKHRKVKLYTRKSGEDKRLAGTTYTDRDRDRDHFTDWGGLLDRRRRPFRYFAVVTEERKHGYLCARDKSVVGKKTESGALGPA